MATKAKSKTEEKELVLEEAVVVPEPDTVSPLDTRIIELEAKVQLLTEVFEFAANELRPIYGMGALVAVFDAVSEKLDK
jgi:hypothetical protein